MYVVCLYKHISICAPASLFFNSPHTPHSESRSRLYHPNTPTAEKDATVFATHSTHKLLAALSQSSYIHVRDGRSPIPHIVFNESYMMYATTSPLYAIIASNDTATAMMDGPVGYCMFILFGLGGGG